MWIPLLFWFSRDFKQAIPSAAIPYGQRFIDIQTADVGREMIYRQGSIFRIARVRTYMLTPHASDPNYGMVRNSDGSYNLTNVVAPVTQTVNDYPTPITTGGALVGGNIKLFDLYINHIFTLAEVHEIIISRVSYYLVRLHRTQRTNITKNRDQVQLTEFKYPIEYFYVGAIPKANQDTSNPYSADDWYKASFVSREPISYPEWKDDNTIPAASLDRFAIKESMQSVIDTLEVTVQQQILYPEMDKQFYNDYIPVQWPDTKSCRDPGMGIIPFKLYNLYDIQPAGSVNASRIREFYLKYNASRVSSTSTAELVLIAQALNFLLISDGTATIRFIS